MNKEYRLLTLWELEEFLNVNLKQWTKVKNIECVVDIVRVSSVCEDNLIYCFLITFENTKT